MLQSNIVETGFNQEQLGQHVDIVTKCQAVIIGLGNAGLENDPVIDDAKDILKMFVAFSRSVEAA